MLTALVPQAWQPGTPVRRVLFEQPILTRPGVKRVALVVDVDALASTLNGLATPGVEVEHVYDY